MSDIFAKVMKWAISASFAICGWAFLVMAQETGSVKPVFVSIVSLGIVYWMYEWGKSEVSKPRMIITVLILVAAILATLYEPIDHMLFSFGGFYTTIWIWTLLIGIPVMMVSYKKFD